MIRLIHFSDIHVSTRPLGWRRADWFSKRVAAWLNLRLLGRGFRFRRASQIVTALAAELHARRPDRVIFSGDATALGFETEVAHAAGLLGVSGPDPLPGLAVPGNHDYCTSRAVKAGAFERYFAPWLAGERVDNAFYPFAQRVGPVWLVAVNSCTANLWAWDASGGVGAEQLDRLRTLLGRLEPGPRILVTHYPVCLANGRPERRTHGLRDLADLLTVAREGSICLWLHGHRHHAYSHPEATGAPFPIICAGSATQNGLWSYGDYAIEGSHFRGLRRVFDPHRTAFRDGESFAIELSC
jgi:3',5'-cyclic AMP phosphodiesterase CpdA